MNTVQPHRPLVVRPQITPSSKGYIVPLVVLALGALAWFAYYFYKQNTVLNAEAQKIRDSFKKTPASLNELDLHYLAIQIESLQMQRMGSNERFKVRLSSFFHYQIKKKFILSKNPNNTLRVQYVETQMGRGGFGKVVRLVDLHNGQETALKVAKIPKHYHTNDPRHLLYDTLHLERANSDLKKEHTNLTKVHTSKIKPLGIQEKPLTSVLTITKLYSSKTKVSLGYEGTLYDGSLDKLQITKFNPKTRLLIAHQILIGMETLLANKLISHDLKPANILFRDWTLPILHISDLAGVTHEDDLEKELKKGLAHTPQYADPNQLEKASDSSIAFIQKGRVRTSEKCALGLTIFWVLTGLESNEGSIEEILKKAKIQSTKEWRALFSALKNNTDKGFWESAKKFFNITNVGGLKEKVEAVMKTVK